MYNDYVQISNRPYRAENLSILWEKQPQRGEIYVVKNIVTKTSPVGAASIRDRTYAASIC